MTRMKAGRKPDVKIQTKNKLVERAAACSKPSPGAMP
jgi:hypothetical protein